MITDEMVEKVYEIWLSHVDAKKSLRAALEAVAPMLIAAYLRKEAAPMGDLSLAKVFLARAQELDPK